MLEEQAIENLKLSPKKDHQNEEFIFVLRELEVGVWNGESTLRARRKEEERGGNEAKMPSNCNCNRFQYHFSVILRSFFILHPVSVWFSNLGYEKGEAG